MEVGVGYTWNSRTVDVSTLSDLEQSLGINKISVVKTTNTNNMNQTLTNIFGVNWRTTAAGLIGYIITTELTQYQSGQWNAKTFLAGVPFLIIGYFAKDKSVTGIGAKATADTSKDATVPTPLPPDVAAPK